MRWGGALGFGFFYICTSRCAGFGNKAFRALFGKVRRMLTCRGWVSGSRGRLVAQRRGTFASPHPVNHLHQPPPRSRRDLDAAEAFNCTRSLPYVKPPGDLFKQTGNASPTPKILRFGRNVGYINSAGSIRKGFYPRASCWRGLCHAVPLPSLCRPRPSLCRPHHPWL